MSGSIFFIDCSNCTGLVRCSTNPYIISDVFLYIFASRFLSMFAFGGLKLMLLRYYLNGYFIVLSILQWKAEDTGKNKQVILFYLNILLAFYNLVIGPAIL